MGASLTTALSISRHPACFSLEIASQQTNQHRVWMQAISRQTYRAAEADHGSISEKTGDTAHNFTRLILVRRNHKAECRCAGPKLVQCLMGCLQTGFAAIQSLSLSDGSSQSHFDYPSATGMVKWNVVPFLNSLSNQIRPPCISTRLLVIFRPRPVPGTSRAFISSERKNFWKILF